MPGSVALDHSGNAWAINTLAGYLNSGVSISELSSSGASLSSSTGFTSNLMSVPFSLVVDGAGYANTFNLGSYSRAERLVSSS